MSEKYCEQHNPIWFRKKLWNFLLILLTLILFTIFLVWVILRPSRPRIILQEALISNFSLSSSPPNYLNARIQVTLACRNSNDRIGILYQKLDAFAVYKDQQITLRTALPAGYQPPNNDVVWTPPLYSVDSPIAPYLAAQLAADQQVQVVKLQIKLDGKIKWKVGTWMSGVYHLYAECPAYIAFGSGQVVNTGVRFPLDAKCDVDVGLGE